MSHDMDPLAQSHCYFAFTLSPSSTIRQFTEVLLEIFVAIDFAAEDNSCFTGLLLRSRLTSSGRPGQSF
jgi:hypothetical protein